MSVTIYGASDDLIEVDGSVYEEFAADEDGNYLACSNGVVVHIVYAESGVWRITPVVGEINVKQAVGDDDDNYSDRLTLDDVSWVVCGTDFAKAGVR
jgi:hypothetical protein